MSSASATRPLRADAQRSRERLPQAAVEVVGRDGASASLEEIARTAGVGSATLHRHFPSRSAHMESLFRHRVDRLAARAQDLSGGSDSGAALRIWIEALLAEIWAQAALAEAILRIEPEAETAMSTCHAIITTAGGDLTGAGGGPGAERHRHRHRRRPDARHGARKPSVHRVTNIVVTAGEPVSARTYGDSLIQHMDDPKTMDHGAAYYDGTFVRTEQGLRIASRKTTMIFFEQPSTDMVPGFDI